MVTHKKLCTTCRCALRPPAVLGGLYSWEAPTDHLTGPSAQQSHQRICRVSINTMERAWKAEAEG